MKKPKKKKDEKQSGGKKIKVDDESGKIEAEDESAKSAADSDEDANKSASSPTQSPKVSRDGMIFDTLVVFISLQITIKSLEYRNNFQMVG